VRALVEDQAVNHVRISLSLGRPQDRGPAVLFDIRVRGQKAGLVEARPESLRVPLSLADARAVRDDRASPYEIPDYVASALRRVFPPGDEPLWLALDQPCGFLPMLPWEGLLGRELKCPIVRLPYFDIQPVAERSSIDIALCVSLPYSGRSSPMARRTMERFAALLPSTPPRPVTLHVFASAESQAALPALANRLAGSYTVDLPPRSTAPGPPASDHPDEALEPGPDAALFRDMRAALSGTPIDAFYFLSDAMLGRERGSLVLREDIPGLESPEDFATEEPPDQRTDLKGAGAVRFVGPAQVARLVSQLGAWAVLFGCPPGGRSMPGLRFLQHHLAPLICGPLLLHDMDDEATPAALEAAFRFLFDPSRQPFPRSTTLALYCSPDWDREPSSSSAAEARRLLEEFTLKGTLGARFLGKDSPAAIRSAQRALERSVADLSLKGGDERKGAEQALRFTADLLAKHLGKFEREQS
jgi:hypothetical protein